MGIGCWMVEQNYKHVVSRSLIGTILTIESLKFLELHFVTLS